MAMLNNQRVYHNEYVGIYSGCMRAKLGVKEKNKTRERYL